MKEYDTFYMYEPLTRITIMWYGCNYRGVILIKNKLQNCGSSPPLFNIKVEFVC